MPTIASHAPARIEAAPAVQDPDDHAVTTCADPSCGDEIDPGPATQCGTSTGDDAVTGCGGHFCSQHLWLDGVLTPQPQNCAPCLDLRALRTAA
ncbi:hypothetical protein [Kitasatospora sp. NBC_01300]|uniref:hypothetical protein n=1 Tax=Kitasatospora sp. NBC_01300 TaxID=2903574 RepID=UPI002F910BCC|nr:hypothetical protein OG556_40245 [Kitasatospora sp. NBC_01300]